MPRLRTLLVLARASNLPTIWSNCLAGWWLGGHDNSGELPFLFAGATFLYAGGMYLNDAFDVDFDRQHRKERPIPSGAISLSGVAQLGLLWLVIGAGCLFCTGITTGILGLILLACILVYDAVHKLVTFSPLLMGACRLLLYFTAASVGSIGTNGRVIWCALALAAYIIGLSFLARRESTRGPLQYWPLMLLAAPIILALCMNTGEYRRSAGFVSLILGLWALRSLRPILWSPGHPVGRTVAGLLAGIVFVDWLAVADVPRAFGFVFLALFGLAVAFQRFIPAS